MIPAEPSRPTRRGGPLCTEVNCALGKTLVVAEKPSVARDIARVLGAGSKGEGFLSGGDWIVSWALGHLVELCDPEEIDPAWKKWRMDALPMLPDNLPTKVISKTRSQFSALKKLMNSPEVDKVICATDSGREGELIFRYIYAQARCKKPVDRLWISSMTDAAIREGFSRIKPDSAYDGLYESARCRSEADWLVGMNASRAFTLRYDVLLSVGRVQTPTLALIVARDREIAAFVPRDYWEIEANFGDYRGTWQNPETKDSKCESQEKAEAIRAEVTGSSAKVVEAKREKKRQMPPQLYDLTELQRDANRLFGLPASKTLNLVQSLYEKHKMLTYPRTDSRYLTRDMYGKVHKVVHTLPEPWASLAAPLKQLEKLPYSPRMYDDAKVSDHHAIVPTGNYSALKNLSDPERKIFDLVARRLIAMHCPDYEYESARIVTRTERGGHRFLSSGVTPLVEGWKAIYKDMGTARKKSEEPPLPALSEGDARTVKSAKTAKKATKPPEHLTDATLLSAMENAGRNLEDEALRESMKDSGLGTPATRAAIIERLIDVGYVQRKGKTLIATPKGDKLIRVVPEQISSPVTTGKWEKALSGMAKTAAESERGALSDRFMSGIRRYAAFLVEAAKTAPADVAFDPEERKAKGRSKSASSVKKMNAVCPLCKTGAVIMNQKAYGCSRWKEGCGFTIWKDALERAGGPEITPDMALSLITTGRFENEQGVITCAPGQKPAWRKKE